MTNPLLDTWTTPHQVPPFPDIRPEHYLPAFEAAMVAHDQEIDAISTNPAPATFTNTILAIEASGRLLGRVSPAFHIMASSLASDEIRELQRNISPQLTAHHSRIHTRPDLFKRIEAVYRGDLSTLNDVQRQLVNETWKSFVRSGAALDTDARKHVLELDETLSRLSTRFGQNVLNDANAFELVIDAGDLTGLPASVVGNGAAEATRRGKAGKYVFTISRSSMTPFLAYSARRDLREKIWQAYTHCAANQGEFDNSSIVGEITHLRDRRAKLLGYGSHAEYVLDDRMAGSPTEVTRLLDQIWAPAKARVQTETKALQDRIQRDGDNFKLAPWDWWYYTEKLRAEKFDLDAEAIKPYFRLENVRAGAFDVANRLYGISFRAAPDIPTYHEDVEAFEVNDHDGSLIGLFLTDYFMRPSKRSGAWMNALRAHATHGGVQTPVIFNTCNFVKGEPTLLVLDEVRTLFHEFGHGLHGLLSKVAYRSLSGTAVKRDFVELPSQIMEHWAIEPEVLKTYARHCTTGEPIPDTLIEKILAAQTFNQGFATTEYLAASYLDLRWHEAEPAEGRTVAEFESAVMQEIGLVEEVAPRYHSTYFQHIFSGGYSAGYYSYIWAEVLDADAFDAFIENGLFDQSTAQSFRRNILETGGTAEPMTLYKRFRGREPDVGPLLRGRGLD